MTNISLADAANVLGLAINGIALTFLATQVVLARRQIEHASKHAEAEAARVKRQATIESYIATMQRLAEMRASLPDDWDKRAIDAFLGEVLTPRNRDEGKIRNLANYLQYYEAIAVAALSNIYDLRVLDSIAGSRVQSICENYASFFEMRRKEVGAETAYRNLEELARQIGELRGAQGYLQSGP